MKAALVLCVLASIGYGVGAVLQAMGAMRSDAEGLVGVVGVGRQPLFLLGLLTDIACWVMSRAALHVLPLSEVQIVLAGSVAVTAFLARVVLAAHLRRADRFAIATAVVGLVVVAASSGHAAVAGVPHSLQLSVLVGIPAMVVLGTLALKLGNSIVLAILAGVSFTASALAARTAHIRHLSLAELLTERSLWAIVAYSLLAVGMHVVALRTGELGPVTAAMWSTEVVIATFVGTAILGDHLRPGWGSPAILGTSAILLATVVLARSPVHRSTRPSTNCEIEGAATATR